MLPRNLVLVTLFASLLVLASHPLQSEPSKPPDARSKILPFTLKDPRDDRSVSFADLKEKKAIVVVFLGTECPLGNAFIPVLGDMHREYAEKGVAFLGVNANQQDTPQRVAAHARQAEVPFPMLKDMNNVVADRFGATTTPEAFVLAAA